MVDNLNEKKKGVFEKWKLTLWGDTRDVEPTSTKQVEEEPTATTTVETETTAPPSITTIPLNTTITNSTADNSTTTGSIVKHFS